MNLNKKAMELPLNIVIMVIIGIVLFGIGFSMFADFSSEGDEVIDGLNNQIRNDISSLECQGGEWVCAPSTRIRDGDSDTFQIYVANRGQTEDEFSIDIEQTTSDGKPVINNENCGSLIIYTPEVSVNIRGGESASFPFTVYTDRITDSPCSFTTIITAKGSDNSVEHTTPLIVRVER